MVLDARQQTIIRAKCKICNDIAFNKQKYSFFCKRCAKAYNLGYQAGYHLMLRNLKQKHTK